MLGAAVVLAFQQRLRGLVGHPRDMSARRRTIALHVTVGAGAIYGGYFGAALGVMLVAALGLVIDEPLARVNAIKNAVSAVVGLGTVLGFALLGPVDWAAVAIVAPATLVGGYSALGSPDGCRPARCARSSSPSASQSEWSCSSAPCIRVRS